MLAIGSIIAIFALHCAHFPHTPHPHKHLKSIADVTDFVGISALAALATSIYILPQPANLQILAQQVIPNSPILSGEFETPTTRPPPA
jgi:hypothetical protein